MQWVRTLPSALFQDQRQGIGVLENRMVDCPAFDPFGMHPVAAYRAIMGGRIGIPFFLRAFRAYAYYRMLYRNTQEEHLHDDEKQ